MIGRAAQCRPWLFREIAHFLATGQHAPATDALEMGAVLVEHLHGLYELYGEPRGARVARKHIGWTVAGLPGGDAFRRIANAIADAGAQLRAVREYFSQLASAHPSIDYRLAA